MLNSDEMQWTVHYIAGWYIQACLIDGRIKARKKKDCELDKMMVMLFEFGTANSEKAIKLLVEKVIRTKMCDGLKYVSAP